MTPLAATDQLFFERHDSVLDQDTATNVVAEALRAGDDGERSSRGGASLDEGGGETCYPAPFLG